MHGITAMGLQHDTLTQVWRLRAVEWVNATKCTQSSCVTHARWLGPIPHWSKWLIKLADLVIRLAREH